MSKTLPAFLPIHHAAHAPCWDFSDGYPPIAYPEVPGRIDAVLEGFERAGSLALERIGGSAEQAVSALHDADYIAFLHALTDGLGQDEEYIPSIFHPDLSAGQLHFQGGMYCAEIGTPIISTTMAAALNSAEAAWRAATFMRTEGGDALALCRPPGHHAGRRRYGGYCFFNNACIAAQVLAEGGGCCAVVDVDYHLGDGTVEFASVAMPYFSLHADPWQNYPHLDATWSGGDSRYVDLTTLPPGVDGAGYLQRLDATLARVDAMKPNALVLSLGFDIAAGDAVQDAPVRLDTADFEALGRRFAARPEPVLILLEGGYDMSRLRDHAEAFARGFCCAQRVSTL